MAEITASAGHAKRGGRRATRLSTRVDLTPMVDLGFLLITFFMVSTAWAESKSLFLGLPADGTPMQLAESAALTVIPGQGNKIYYYHGDFEAAVKNNSIGETNYSYATGIGDIIRKKQLALIASGTHKRTDLMLIIKPALNSSYGNIVDLLDETLINNVTRYAIVDLSEAEKEWIGRVGD